MKGKGITLRSLIGGIIMAAVMAGVNSFLTLKVGIIEEGPIISMMMFTAILMIFGQRVSNHEAVMVATLGSAGGSLGFISNFYAAHDMIGTPLTLWEMTLFALATSLVGLVVAIFLRQLFVVREPLNWPTSKATIAAINAMTGAGDKKQSIYLLLFTLVSFLWVFAGSGLRWVPEATMFGAVLAKYGVGIAWSPFIIGAGYLIGMRVGLGFLVGAVALWAIAPYVPEPKPHLYIWPGVMFLLTSGLTVLILNWPTIVRAIKSIMSAKQERDENPELDQVMRPRSYKIMSIAAVVLVTFIMWQWFDIAIHLTTIMLIVGALLFNLIATRAAGETAFNPVRVMGIMLQGVTAAFGGGAAATNLTGAGFAAGSIGQTSILVQDTYFGRHFKTPVRWQWFGQALVLPIICLVSALVYSMVADAYTIEMGSEEGLAAPVAKMWAAMSLLFSGESNLPAFAIESMVIGGLFGILFGFFDHFVGKKLKQMATEGRKSILQYFPHSVGIGIALIIPIYYSLAFFFGAILLCKVLPRFKISDGTLNSIAAAGIVGEGIGGLLVAILIATGVLAG